MSNTNNDSSLVRLLKVINNLTPTEILAAISHTIKDITTSAPLLIEFNLFLLNVHDILVSEFTDSSILAEIYRVIRYCLSSPDYCDLIVSQDIHWIIVASVEVNLHHTYNYSYHTSLTFYIIIIYREMTIKHISVNVCKQSKS